MTAVLRAAFGIDQAARSGWAVAVARKVVEHGVAVDHAGRVRAVERALWFAGNDPTALLVAFEDHGAMPLDRLTNYDRKTARRGRDGAPERSTRSILGQGKAYGRWEAVLDALGHPSRLRIDVEPGVWRRRVHGVIAGDVKGAAMRWASRALGEEIDDDNEAEACCLATFASIDGVMMLEQEKLRHRLTARAKRAASKQLALGETDARPKLLGKVPARIWGALVANDNGVEPEEGA